MTPKLFFFRLSILVGFVFLLFQWIKTKKIPFNSSLTAWFLLAFLVVVLKSALSKQEPFLSQSKTFEYLGWVLFFLFVWLKKSFAFASLSKSNLQKYQNHSFLILELTGVPLVIYGFIQHFGLDPIVWNPGGTHIFSLVGNAVAFATFMATLIMFTTIRYLSRPVIWRLFLIEAEMIALIWSYERGPTLALLLGSLVVFFLFISFKNLRVFLKRFLFVSLLLIGTGGLLFIYKLHTAETQRMLPANWSNDAGVIGRAYLFEKGMELLALNLWNGVGVGNFSFEYLKLRSDNPVFYKTRIGIAESTHNTFLDIAVETGIIGGILFLAIWVSTFSRLCLKLKNSPPDDSILVLSYLAPLLVAFISLQFIFPDPLAEAMTGYLLGGSAVILPRKITEIKLSRMLIVALVSVTLFLFASGVIYSLRVAIADFYAGSAKRALHKEDIESGIKNYLEATNWDSWNPAHYQNLGKSYEMANRSKEALLNYNYAITIQPKNPFIWSDIGRLAAMNGWKRRSLTAYAKAIEIDPYNPNWYHDAALSALSLGGYPMALYCARVAFSLDPNPSNAQLLAEAQKKMGRK